jgi:valyl-tRNA synthetase
MSIEKTYDPAATEIRLYQRWEESGAFACAPQSGKGSFCIMMPPPNVTGSLHMGHALTFTLQDILTRYQRMRGKDVLWQPGTDHAGIATQMVVERELAATKQRSRRDLGREDFLEKVWEWKEKSGGTITKQLRRLGASCDWSREKFTMDAELSKAVTRAFVTLYKEGLIYRDKRLVNWDPKMLTAVSDLEVEQREVKGHMWHFRYPLEKDPTQYVCVATTRPETMLGDGAVAVNPADERYQHLIGQYVILPLANRRIPIIADEHADPEKGSGAVKITAAHDFNDFAVWQRHRDKDYFMQQQDGGLINLFDAHARMNENAPEAYRGLDRYEARKRVIADLEALGLLDKIDSMTHAVPHGDRSGVVIEPWLSEQWYCDAATLAQPALKAVEDGKTKFVPEQWTNTYYAWMRNIEPWCISRQLWWGHQIPAWYGPILLPDPSVTASGKYVGGALFVAQTEAEAISEAEEYYQSRLGDVKVQIARDAAEMQASCGEANETKIIKIYRDEDVLDTWFSSALWPFSTLGWPQQTSELKNYYPTDVLVTGFDIIFFWVARMMMMGLHFQKDVPFRTVYIHALVRDEKGQKMSKTKGNVIDPLDVIEKYGCDALRFTLANMSTPGRDIKLATGRIEGNRNFATKLWNAARFCEMNGCKWIPDFDPTTIKRPVNQWIVGEAKLAADKIAAHADEYRFDLATSTAYEFMWNTFCDWYVEFTKPIIGGTDEAVKAETRATTSWVLGHILHILHPFMPYITEELWTQLVGGQMLMTSAWPVLPESLLVATDMNWVKGLIEKIRGVRIEINVPAAAKISLVVVDSSHDPVKRFQDNVGYIMRMARVNDGAKSIDFVSDEKQIPAGSARFVYAGVTYAIPLADLIDLDKERARLGKEVEKWAAEIKKVDAKLANPDFVSRAPQDILDEHHQRKAEAEAMIAKLDAAQKSLSA